MPIDERQTEERSEASQGTATYELDWTDPAKMEDEALAQFITGQFKTGKDRRRNWEQQACKQMAWAVGQQDTDWVEESRDLDQVKDQLVEGIPMAYQYPIKVNGITRVLFQRIAFLLEQPPTLFAMPASQDDDDVNGASVQTDLLQYMWRAGSDPVKRRMVIGLWEMFCTGIQWIHPHWDPFVGERDKFKPNVSEEMTPQERAAGVSAFKKRIAKALRRGEHEIRLEADDSLDLPRGLVSWDFRSGFDITEPEYATTDKADWLIDTQWRSMEYLRFRYGDRAAEIQPTDSAAVDYYDGWKSRYGPAGGGEGEVGSSFAPRELVQVHVLWRPRRPWCPSGAMVVCTEQKHVLFKGPNPYIHGYLPFIPMTEFATRAFRPTCTVYNMMELQGARNRLRSQIAAFVHKTTAPKYLHEKSAQLPQDALDSEDRIIELADGGISKVRALDTPTLPPQAMALEDLYRRDMQDVGGVHESTTGRGESSQQSGRHAALLQQADTRSTTITRWMIETAIERAGEQSLFLWWQFVPTKRMIVIPGEGAESKVLQFKGEDLFRGDSESPGPFAFNVQVRLGSDAMQQRRMQFAGFMVESGAWNAQDPAVAMRLERIFGEDAVGDRRANMAHRRNATDENRKMRDGDTVAAAPGDNDAIHLDEHLHWTTTGEYREAVRKNEKIKDLVEVHIREHHINAAEKLLRPAVIGAYVKELLMAELGITLGPDGRPTVGPQPGTPAGQSPGPQPGPAGVSAQGRPPVGPPPTNGAAGAARNPIGA